MKVKQINSACDKAGLNLLQQAKDDITTRKVTARKDTDQATKEIASYFGVKAKGKKYFY